MSEYIMDQETFATISVRGVNVDAINLVIDEDKSYQNARVLRVSFKGNYYKPAKSRARRFWRVIRPFVYAFIGMAIVDYIAWEGGYNIFDEQRNFANAFLKVVEFSACLVGVLLGISKNDG